MAFNFPNNPTTNDTHSIGDKIWIYTGTGWKMQNTASGSAGSYANSAFDAANTADQRAVTSGDYANSAFGVANAAFEAANNAVDTWVRDAANSASSYANSAYLHANSSFTQANIAVAWGDHSAQTYATQTYVNTAITNLVNSAPTTLDTLNELAVALNNDPSFATTISDLVGVARAHSNSAYDQSNVTFVYADSSFQAANSAGDYANSAYSQSNTGTILAQAAFDAANNAVDTWVRDAANSASSYANSSFGVANTSLDTATSAGDYANSAFITANTATDSATSAGVYANAAFNAANNAVDTWVRDAANSASDYANSAFDTANNAGSVVYTPSYALTRIFNGDDVTTNFTISTGYSASSILVTENGILQVPNVDYIVSGTTLTLNTTPTTGTVVQVREISYTSPFDDLARETANAAFEAANNAVDTWVRDAANSASDYANSSFITANAAFEAANNAVDTWVRDAANSASSYANSAYTHANSSYAAANINSSDIVIAGSYANSAYVRANVSLNTESGGAITGDISITGNLTVTGCTASLLVNTVQSQDHILDLGYGTTGAPTQNAGIRIIRGDENAAQIRWHENDDHWDFTNDGTNYLQFAAKSGEVYANSAFDTANAASSTATSAYIHANAAFAAANSGGGGGGSPGGVSLGMLIALT
jgi:hypothetical protein